MTTVLAPIAERLYCVVYGDEGPFADKPARDSRQFRTHEGAFICNRCGGTVLERPRRMWTNDEWNAWHEGPLAEAEREHVCAIVTDETMSSRGVLVRDRRRALG